MTSREQRTVRWGAAAGGLILLYVLLLDPYLVRSAESHALVEERESRLARLVALERSLPAYRERLSKARAIWDAEVAPRLLAAEIPAVAASALSERVRGIAAQSFLEVESENVLPSVDDGRLTSVPVQFSLRGDIYGLRDFLAALEASPSFLHLRELRVNSLTAGLGPQLAGGGAPLQITVTVEGYLGGSEAGGGLAVEAGPLPSSSLPPDGMGGGAQAEGGTPMDGGAQAGGGEMEGAKGAVGGIVTDTDTPGTATGTPGTAGATSGEVGAPPEDAEGAFERGAAADTGVP